MAYIDCSGRPVGIGRQIGRRGGEGTVYESLTHQGHVVKLYHEVPDGTKAAKLEHMKSVASQEILSFAAWPRHLVWDATGKHVRGFIMPRVEGKEVHEVYGVKERFLHFPTARWDFLIQVARNAAAAFEEIHRLGVVVGDVNEGNLLVKRDATVCVIDCDSFQATSPNGFTWTCDVGIAHWTAPELQSESSFRGLRRNRNHDLFGLAVLIFRLLWMGRHPFAGTRPRNADWPLEKAIENFHYAYGMRAASLGITPPPHSLSISVLPVYHRALFERAFQPGSHAPGTRPSGKEWVDALDSLAGTLTKCKADSAHRYPSNLSSCPWCSISASGGPAFFIGSGGIGGAAVPPDLWQRIAAVSLPTPSRLTASNLPAIPCKPQPLPEPTKLTNGVYTLGIVLAVVAFFVLVSGAIYPALGIGLVAAGCLYQGKFKFTYADARRNLSSAISTKQTEINALFQELAVVEQDASRKFVSLREEFQKKYSRLIGIKRERDQELQLLENQKRQSQLNDFLDRAFVSSANVPGIGPKLKSELLAYGIETALDIPKANGVPGIGPAKYSALMSWRRMIEGRFHFNPNTPIPHAAIVNLDNKMRTLRAALEAELCQAPARLQKVGTEAATKRELLMVRINLLNKERCQLAATLSSLPEY